MSDRAQASAAHAGPRVGDYRLLTRIGEGGMGVVHLAEAPDGSRVALKVLRPHVVGDDEARQRLSREVSSLRRVRSPRVAEVLDADPWGETPYVATRYVPGLSLHEHVRREGTLAVEDLRWFAAGLMEAVIAVHTVGVLHRDIKPSNVLLEGRSPVLIDFGLARLAEDPRLTATGWLLGTPGYLAPEILYGDDATTASDVHSWAATVVFAATGRPPYGGGPAMAVMDRVRRGEHDLSGVPEALRPLLEQCLSPDPARRPEAAAVLADLRAPLPSPRTGPDDGGMTMPFALVVHDDADRTRPVVDASPPTQVVEQAADAPTTRHPQVESGLSAVEPQPAPTRPLTAPFPREQLRHHPPHQPARAPYMTPAPPQHQPLYQRPDAAPYPPWQPPPAGMPRLQRGLILLGLLALVTAGFAYAPYAGLAVVAVAVLLVRTYSWTADAARDRRWRRGGRRWYDGVVTVLTSPWYLVRATVGTVMLVLWSAGLAFLVGLVYAALALPPRLGVAAMGAVVAYSLWWGPGSARLRAPVRRSVLAVTREPTTAWAVVALLVGAAGLIGLAVAADGVHWTPQPGPPWRNGTVFGDLLAML